MEPIRVGAWEEGLPNWARTGLVIKDRPSGAFLGGFRMRESVAIRTDSGVHGASSRIGIRRRPRLPAAHLRFRPNVWVAAKIRTTILGARKKSGGLLFPDATKGLLGYWMTRLDGGPLTEAFPAPNARADRARASTCRVGCDRQSMGRMAADGRVQATITARSASRSMQPSSAHCISLLHPQPSRPRRS